MKKKYIMLALLSGFILHNNIFTMEKEVEEEVGHIPYIPHELIAKIIRHIVEDHIKNWDGITDFQIIKRQIARDLLNNHLVSKSFSEFHHKYGKFNMEYVNSVIKEIDQKLQDKILAASINRKEQTSRLIEALNKRNQQEITDSINKGADINAKAISDMTALMWAARKGHIDIVKLLINKGVDVNAVDKYGVAALKVAVMTGNKDIVELLIKSGADVNPKNDFNRYTALHIASIKGYTDIAKLLIESGVNNNIDELNQFGDTALMLAAEYNHIEIVKLLIQLGANINKSNNFGFTALMSAARGGHIDIVKLLINKGANIYAADDYDQTALELAKIYGHQDIAELLIRNGANN